MIIISTDPNCVNLHKSTFRCILISKNELIARLSKIDYRIQNNNNTKSLQILVETWPYALAEFKPTFGTIFEDYLQNYSHWAYADIDLLYGRLNVIIPVSILNKYDIYTSSFGDTFRLYLRGQLTIHKNIEIVNNVWKKCRPLTHFKDRLDIYEKTRYKHWPFQSAEGCYSKAVYDSNLSVYYASSQLSDAYRAPDSSKESLLIHGATIRCYNEYLRNVDFVDKSFSKLNRVNDDITKYQVTERSNYSCAYWIHPSYQVKH
jgi:hypothetical protein